MTMLFDSIRSAMAPSPVSGGLGVLPQWRLEDLYESMESPRFAADLERARREAKEFAAAWRGKLGGIADSGEAGERLAESVRGYEALQDLIGRVMSYASLLYASDTSDAARAKFYGDVNERVTELAGDLLFFELELNRIADATLEAAMARPALGRYRPWLEDIRKEKPHQLPDEIEQLFLEKSVSGAAAWNRLFDETMSALRFDFEGESLTLEPLLGKLQDPDEKKREAAANALALTLGANLRLFSLVTNTLAKDKEVSDRWRKFEDVADSRHLANRVEPEVVEALVTAVTDAYPRLSHRYYALKARWFGQERLAHWDRNAPLPGAPPRVYAWETARDTVLDAYRGFSPRMADIARRFFDEGWIDAPVRPGKAPGAFAHPTTPSAHPYVLVNYLGKPRDVTTLAHELGHGVHQVLAGVNGALMAPTPLTLAETASVFGEMLTFRAMLAATDDPAERKTMLASKVEDMLNTVVRQIAFYKFERLVHLERRKGELTADRISELWMSVQAESLGPAIELKSGYETYWAYIGHFIHSPFYVYAYAFGDCLVNSLYGVYERSREGFAERYLAMLAAGGSKSYSELLKPFGLDAKDPAFWSIGLSVIERMIGELEEMG
ncbi:MAG: M3 family oligoendopeptidase [Roseiarcus sp.]|uniref:M3 family oligoendopeptidase n=2 Tax=Roseiarcus sp. TaxID=1969460 RepID=UPI003C3430BB